MSVFAEFEMPVTASPLSTLLADHPDVTVEVDAIIPTGGSSRYVWITGETVHDVVDGLASTSDLDHVSVLDEGPTRALVRFDWSPTDTTHVELVDSVDGRIAGATGTADGWFLRIRFPSQEALNTYYERALEHGIDIDLVEYYDQEPTFVDDRYGMSEKQREAVELAYTAGYFDTPRQVSLADLGEHLGISEQGVSERLRRGLARFLAKALAEQRANGTADQSGNGR